MNPSVTIGGRGWPIFEKSFLQFYFLQSSERPFASLLVRSVWQMIISSRFNSPAYRFVSFVERLSVRCTWWWRISTPTTSCRRWSTWLNNHRGRFSCTKSGVRAELCSTINYFEISSRRLWPVLAKFCWFGKIESIFGLFWRLFSICQIWSRFFAFGKFWFL